MQEKAFKIVTEQIGITILLHRLRSGFSQFTLGIEVQLSTNQIGRIERGETNPTVFTLMKIANTLNVEISEFFIKKNAVEKNKMLEDIKILQEKTKKK